MVTAVVVARVVLAVVFATAGIAKALDRPTTVRTLRDFGVPAALSSVAAVLLVVAELATAVLLVTGPTAWIGGFVALALLVAFGLAAVANLARGRAPACNCFGQVHSEPIGPALLVRNGVLAGLALVVVVGGADDAGGSLWSNPGDVSSTEVALLAAVVLLGLAVVGLRARVRALAADHEQLAAAHERLSATVAALADGPVAPAGAPAVAPAEPASDAPPAPPPPTFAPGLPVGVAAPTFALERADDDRTTSLDDLLAAGRPVVLLFVAPTCGTCHGLLPKPAGWTSTYGDVLSFVLVTAGTREANAGIDEGTGGFEPVLLDPGSTRTAYEVAATPGGVVVGRDGAIASETVYGVAEIAMLVMRTAAGERAAAGATS